MLIVLGKSLKIQKFLSVRGMVMLDIIIGLASSVSIMLISVIVYDQISSWRKRK